MTISKANVKNIYPLTPMQEGMLFHALRDDGAAYFEQLCYRLAGRLVPALFRAAWDELVRRHDALRTVFVHKDVPRPLQIVLKSWRIDFAAHDLRGMAREEAEERILSLKAQDRATPFNLAKDPLTRIAVVSLSDRETEVIWSHHHIILDGWSAGILQGELLEIYAALAHGRRHLLPEPAPFSGYVVWIGKQDREASHAFWRGYLDGFSQATGIPRFPTGLPAQGGSRGSLGFRLDRRRSEQLAALAAGNGVTLNVLLQALWGVLLCRYNGTDQAVFAATVSGRPDELKGIEGMVGLFINAVPVRVRLDRSRTLADLLQALQAETLAASRHHWCSLADVQAESALKQALLDHILIFENYPLDEQAAERGMNDGGGFSVVKAELREQTNYPFELSIIPGAEIEFRMGYDAASYGHDQLQRVAWSLQRLIDGALEHGEAPLCGLELLSPVERELILTAFNRPQGAEAAETVADLLERRAAEDPERIALLFEGLQMSYRELNEAANGVAHRLLECGAQPDQVIGILMDRSERMMAGLWGIVKSGAAYLPLDPTFPAARIAYMLEDSGCRLLLTESKHRGHLAGVSRDAVIVELDRLPAAVQANPCRVAKPDNLLYLIYTSGSTGLPKGVMLEQRNVISFNRNMAAAYGLAAGDVILALTTITFDISVLELICSLLTGMTVVLASDAVAGNPARAAALLGRDGVNVLQITPSRLKLMLEETELAAFSGLKALLVGGEPLPEPLFRRLRELPATALFNVYGPTETTIWSTTARLGDAPLTVGVPLADEDVLILSSAAEIMPSGVWGEICIGGQGVARGYWNRPELTADRFIPHPARPGERIYRTGDLGRFLPGGEIQCGGRMDNQVKVRGYRIETGEIEQNLLQIAGVKEAVAHVVEIDGLNEIAAYIVADAAGAPSPAELRSRLALSLPDYMLPSYYLTLDRVPLTPNGKTDRKALPLPAAGTGGMARSGADSYLPPQSESEMLLASIWERILGVERVGRADNFFDLGGHSIKAIRIASAVAKEMGLELPLALIFQHPVLSSLAAALAGNSAADRQQDRQDRQDRQESRPQQDQKNIRPQQDQQAGGSQRELTLSPLPIQEWYETSPGQRRLWILQQMAPESAAYNMPVALKMQGAVDTAALEKSVHALAQRHEALRTVFRERDGLPMQIILPAAERLLTTVDLRDQATPWQRALQLARQQAACPFNLADGPAFRVAYYRTGDDEGLLLLLMHHINGDGWSWGILLRELAGLYHRQANRHAADQADRHAEDRAAPALQYKEWAQHQNRALASGEWEAMRSYWRRTLAGSGTPLNLHTDFPRPALRKDGGDSVTVTIPAQTVARLSELGRARGATLFMVLLTLLKTLLHRMSGQDEITVGIPVAGRPMQQIEGVVGFFVNTLALRSRIASEERFEELLDQVRRTALDGYQHQLYPFDLLVNELSLPRDTGHAPLFDVMAVLQEEGEQVPSFGNLEVSAVPLATGASRFDLAFNFLPAEQGMILDLEYATELFLPETAQRLAESFLKLADSAAGAPERALKDLEILSDREAAAVRACGAGQVRPWPQQSSMVDVFQEQAARFPDAPAVVASDRKLSYLELDRLSDLCALGLRQRCGLEAEEAVGVMTGRNSSLPVALLGILKGGGVYLPIDPDQPESRIRHIIADSGLRSILVDEETAAQAAVFAGQARVVELAALLQLARETVLGTAGEAVLETAGEASGEATGGTGWKAAGEGIAARLPRPDQAAYVIYTSGSTGLPKGVLLQHGGFVNMVLDQIATFGVTRQDRCLLFSSFSFDGAMSEIFLALHSGAALVVARREQTADPQLFSLLLEQTGATVATLSPVYLNALRTAGASLGPLRVIVTAGEAAIAADLIHYARELTVFNAYGPTEASVCSAIHRVDAGRPYHGSIPIGAPMANSELLLLDERLQPVPFGVGGEICVAGPGLARGYLNKPQLTAAAFVAHPFENGRRLYRTGDLGRRLADGAVEFLGRKDDQVKVRGFRIECGEVERALLNHPAIGGAVVVARGEGPNRELVAFLLQNADLDPAHLKAELSKQLPSFMLPARFVPLQAFPLNVNGKVDRKLLAGFQIVDELTAGSGEPPATVMETRLAAIWEEILGRKGISRRDSFFEIGGQSIAAIRVAAAIHRQLGLQLPLPALFHHATLQQLALECERTAAFAQEYREDPHLLLSRGGKRQIFAFPPINGYPIAYGRLAELLDDVSLHGFSFIESEDRLLRYAESIERLQPAGPLTLMGYSSGGNLAFEMAKELERRGRTVADLILLDSWKRLPGAPVTENVQEWADEYAPDPELYGNLAELMESPHIRELVFGKLRRYLAYTESVTTGGSIGAAIHLLRAEDAGEIEGLSQEWRLHTSGACTLHQGGGAHLDMLKEPWVSENAEVIKSFLSKT